jgi:drug/metabolite transporter (DMT)-like permease
MGVAVWLYGEPLGWPLVISVLLSVISIGLFSASDGLKFDPILLAVFAGAGLVDAALNAIRQSFHSEMNDWQQSTVIFGSAFLFGSLGLLKSEWRQQFSKSAVGMGFLLGLVNFFSIVFLLRGLHFFQGVTATFFAFNNVGILVLTSLVAWLFFKQPMGFYRWMGLLVAVLAIASAYFNLLWTLA